jgi:hypothetical protein
MSSSGRAIVRTVLACLTLGGATDAFATIQWTAALPVGSIEVVGGNGGFIIIPNRWSDSNCTAGGIYIYPNTVGNSTDGVKAMLATALAAQASGMKVSVLYDNSSGSCFGEFIQIVTQ